MRPFSVPFSNLLERLHHERHVAKVGQPGLHEHGQHRARLNGVDAQIVGNVIKRRQVIRIADAAVGAQQPQGLVLHR